MIPIHSGRVGIHTTGARNVSGNRLPGSAETIGGLRLDPSRAAGRATVKQPQAESLATRTGESERTSADFGKRTLPDTGRVGLPCVNVKSKGFRVVVNAGQRNVQAGMRGKGMAETNRREAGSGGSAARAHSEQARPASGGPAARGHAHSVSSCAPGCGYPVGGVVEFCSLSCREFGEWGREL